MDSSITLTEISSAYYFHYDLSPSQVNKFMLFHSTGFPTLTKISVKSRESTQSVWATEILSDTLPAVDLQAGGQAVFQFPTYPHSPYAQYRLFPEASSGLYNVIAEMVPLVCYQPVVRQRVTLSLKQAYTWAVGDEVYERATARYKKGCFVDGELPAGLTITAGCGIHGTVTGVVSRYSVAVYWEDEWGT